MRTALLFFLLLYSISSLSKQWVANKELPYEVRALISSFNSDYLTAEEQEKLKSSLQILDSLILELPTSERYFLGKTAVYKWVLENSSTMTVPASFNLNQALEKKDYSKLSDFSKWLLGAIRSDIISLSKDPDFQRYSIEKKANRFTFKTRTLRRKIKLIAPWAYLLAQDGATQVNLQLMRFQADLLQEILSQYKIYYHLNSLTIPKRSTKLSLFRYIDTKMQSSSATTKQKDTELSYLDTIIKEHRKENLPLPQNDWNIDTDDSWSPEDESIPTIQEETDGSYIAPNELPKPVDDWILSY